MDLSEGRLYWKPRSHGPVAMFVRMKLNSGRRYSVLSRARKLIILRTQQQADT